jgi:uncharacterized membrane protein/mono/diheme cytochrome c family protein
LLLAATARADDAEALAGRVRAIFQAKCVECHGADLARPKGRFGYVLDLTRVAANPKLIVPGDPARSELYQMVLHDEMPGKGATAPPLTTEEKDTVRRWIEAGAAGLPSDPPAAPLAFGPRVVRFIGQFHPLTTHFPIAFLIAALPAELIWRRTRRTEWATVARFCVAVGAAGAVVSAALGWCAAAFHPPSGFSRELLAWHRWLGTATALWAAWTAWLAGRPRWRGGLVWSLCVGVVLVGGAGYLGAALVFGLHHLTW